MALLRRLYRAPELLQLLATFGVVLMVQDLTLAIWGAEDLPLPRPPWLRALRPLRRRAVPALRPRADRRRPAGARRALAAAAPHALRAPWCARRPRTATWWRRSASISACCSPRSSRSVRGSPGWAARWPCPTASANLQMDLSTITDAFVVVVVGGLGSIGGAYLASLLIGVLQAFGISLLPEAHPGAGVRRDGGGAGRAAAGIARAAEAPHRARPRRRRSCCRRRRSCGRSGWCCCWRSPPRRCWSGHSRFRC